VRSQQSLLTCVCLVTKKNGRLSVCVMDVYR
jgi:hypothetical protein